MKDREKEFRERVKCGIACFEDTPNNQIEEVAKVICKTVNKKELKHCEVQCDIDCLGIARELLKHYQPKIPEDSVVISRERYDKLISLYDEVWSAYGDGENNAKVYYENIKIPQVRKEGAREFYDKFNKNICYFELKNKSTEYKEGYIQAVADICGKLDKTAIELGVDLREYYGKF